MSIYQLTTGGVIYLPTNSFISEGTNDDWKIYLAWVADGNIPDADPTATNSYKYKLGVASLTTQYLADVDKLQSSWLSAAVLDETTETTKKSSVAALISSRKAQYLTDVASLKSQYPIQA